MGRSKAIKENVQFLFCQIIIFAKSHINIYVHSYTLRMLLTLVTEEDFYFYDTKKFIA